MKRKTIRQLFHIRQAVIDLYLLDDNKQTRRELNRIIKSLTRIINKAIK